MGALNIGKYTYGDPIRRGDLNTVNIGKFCSIAEGVILDCGFQHNTKSISTFPFSTKFPGCEHLPSHIYNKGDINIGNDVWIGEGACIMGGVTVGDGAVIGFGSVVTKNVRPYTVVAGSPAKWVKNRFKFHQEMMLLEMEWWEWTELQIRDASPHLMSNNIEELYDYYLNQIK